MRWPIAIWQVLRAVTIGYFVDQVPRLAAALAYYTVFSIAPLLIIAIGIAGLVFGEEAARGQITAQMAGLVGVEGARAVEALVEGAGREEGGWAATLVGIAILLFGASCVFGELQTSLNQLWGVTPPAGAGWLDLLRDRFLSFSMVLVTGFLLLVSLVLSAGLAALAAWLAARWPDAAAAVGWANVLSSWAVTIALFALIYRFLPDVRLAWGDVALGAVSTAALFTAGKWAIGLYLGRTASSSAYGAIGSLVVLLVWVYYSAQVFYLGAEVTKALTARRHPLQPKRTAAPPPPDALPVPGG